MKEMKIIFSDDSRDFASWMHEKSSNVLRDLCRILQEVPAVQENDSFRYALDDALKMYALCHGNLNGIRCDLVYSLLMQYGISGYRFLHDLVHRTEESPIMQDILQNKRIEDILVLIEQNRKENRGKIAEQLALLSSQNRWVQQIAADLEYVHNGEKTWDWFYSKHGNDRNTFMPHFSNDLFRSLYEYFQSDDFKYADNATAIIENIHPIS